VADVTAASTSSSARPPFDAHAMSSGTQRSYLWVDAATTPATNEPLKYANASIGGV
jgi:hypothetical protein